MRLVPVDVGAGAPGSDAASGDGMDDQAWISDEPRVTRVVRRVLARAAGRWGLVTALTLASTAAAVAVRATRPPSYEATLFVRFAEGEVTDPGTGPHPPRAIADYINNVALTRSRLQRIMKKHRWSTSFLASDPVKAVDEFREDIGVEVSRNYFLYERTETDEPRSANVTLKLAGADPDAIVGILHDIREAILEEQSAHRGERLEQARTLVDAQIAAARQRVRVLQDRAARARTDDGPPGAHLPAAPPGGELQAAIEKVVTLEQLRSRIEYSATAEKANLGLRLELFDEGLVARSPHLAPPQLAGWGLGALAVLGVLWLLVVGAFNDRVYATADLEGGGLPVLGAVGRFPGDEAGPYRARASARGV